MSSADSSLSKFHQCKTHDNDESNTQYTPRHVSIKGLKDDIEEIDYDLYPLVSNLLITIANNI